MDTFSVLADPTRREIVATLASGEQAFGELADRFEMSRPAVSQHLKLLRDSGVVRVRKDAQRRIYSLEAGSLDEMATWLAEVGRFWNSRLDALEAALAEDEGE